MGHTFYPRRLDGSCVDQLCASPVDRTFDRLCHVWVRLVSGLTGDGICTDTFSYVIIAAILNYVVDGYGHYSASALGGVVFVRNLVSLKRTQRPRLTLA
jgi:hypothetical protein